MNVSILNVTLQPEVEVLAGGHHLSLSEMAAQPQKNTLPLHLGSSDGGCQVFLRSKHRTKGRVCSRFQK